ncbi:MAG: hypothetical protein LBC14_08185 [Desulfovibrio sp.]|nr:hypothetical protein [Desulfovibrio sp.]
MAVNALSLAVCLRSWRGAGIYALLRDGEECGQHTVAFDADVARTYVETPGFNRQHDALPDPAAAPVFRDDRSRRVVDAYESDDPVCSYDCVGDDIDGNETGRFTRDAFAHKAEYAACTSEPPATARNAGAAALAGRRGAARGPAVEDEGVRIPDAVSGGRESAVRLSDSFPFDGRLSSIAQFSAPWRALLEKTCPAPLVWTYEELAGDLQGNASPERSRCLKTLIAALALPRGSSAFWPLSLSDSVACGGTGASVRAAADGPESAPSDRAGMSETALVNDTGVSENAGVCPEFAAGVRLLGAGAVMYFGTGAVSRSGFALTIRAPYTQQIVEGLQHILLPALSALAEDRENTEKAVAYLRSVLTDHPLLRARTTKSGTR